MEYTNDDAGIYWCPFSRIASTSLASGSSGSWNRATIKPEAENYHSLGNTKANMCLGERCALFVYHTIEHKVGSCGLAHATEFHLPKTPVEDERPELDSGNHLLVVRSWMQQHAVNGSAVRWSSDDMLQGMGVSVMDMEDLAQRIKNAVLKEVPGSTVPMDTDSRVEQEKIRAKASALSDELLLNTLLGLDIPDLDEAVHEAASSAASTFNNSASISDQVQYLKKQGWTGGEIVDWSKEHK